MSDAVVGIVAALPAEARCLPRARVPDVRVTVSGPGPARARQAAEEHLGAGARALVSWGVAGALDPSLRPGTLVLAVVATAMDGTTWTGDSRWRERLLEVADPELPVTGGTLLQADDVMAGAEEKRAEFERTGACVVDTETGAVAAAAQAAGVPWVAVRAVVDPAGFDLPHAALAAVDEDGHTHPGRVITASLRRPQELPRLMRLGRDFGAAKRTLRRLGELAGPRLLAP